MPPKKRTLTAAEIKAKNISETQGQLQALFDNKNKISDELCVLTTEIASLQRQIEDIAKRTAKAGSLDRLENQIYNAIALIEKMKDGRHREEARKKLDSLRKSKEDMQLKASLEEVLAIKRQESTTKQVELGSATQRYFDFKETKAKGLGISIESPSDEAHSECKAVDA